MRNASERCHATAAASATKEEPSTRFAKDQLKAIIERVEHLEEEKKAISDDIRDVFAEAKGNGFDPKIIRKIISIRAQEPEKRVEEETLIDLYLAALGAN